MYILYTDPYFVSPCRPTPRKDPERLDTMELLGAPSLAVGFVQGDFSNGKSTIWEFIGHILIHL